MFQMDSSSFGNLTDATGGRLQRRPVGSQGIGIGKEAGHGILTERQFGESDLKQMSAKDYFDLKAFSYFPSDFTFSKFLAAAQQCNPDDLPFGIDNQ